jgi:hypothetical protein
MAADATMAVYLPTSHRWHALAPVAAEYFPAPQSVQLLSPSLEYAPAAQARQVLAEDALTVGENVPATQATQTVARAVSLYVPAGQGMQPEAPAATYSPAAQAMQPEAPGAAYLPAGQAGQFAAPAPAEYVPAAHSAQSAAPAPAYLPAGQASHVYADGGPPQAQSLPIP